MSQFGYVQYMKDITTDKHTTIDLIFSNVPPVKLQCGTFHRIQFVSCIPSSNSLCTDSLLLQLNLSHRYTMRSFMFDILQGDMTRSKVILTFTCLKMYIARSGDTSGSRTTLFI